MSKSGLIGAVSTTTSLMKREAGSAVNASVHVFVSEVHARRRVSAAGFGSINPTQRGARVGRHPQTGTHVTIAPSRAVRFAAGDTFTGGIHGTRPVPALTISSGSAPAMTKVATPGAHAILKKTADQSTKRAARRTPVEEIAGCPVEKVVRRAPVAQTMKRAPARNTAKRSANKAVRRAPANRPAKHAPARKAAKLSAKKAVRRA